MSTAGSIKLLARSQATAYISVGDWTQNADLIPFTINSAIAPIPFTALRVGYTREEETRTHR